MKIYNFPFSSTPILDNYVISSLERSISELSANNETNTQHLIGRLNYLLTLKATDFNKITPCSNILLNNDFSTYPADIKQAVSLGFALTNWIEYTNKYYLMHMRDSNMYDATFSEYKDWPIYFKTAALLLTFKGVLPPREDFKCLIDEWLQDIDLKFKKNGYVPGIELGCIKYLNHYGVSINVPYFDNNNSIDLGMKVDIYDLMDNIYAQFMPAAQMIFELRSVHKLNKKFEVFLNYHIAQETYEDDYELPGL